MEPRVGHYDCYVNGCSSPYLELLAEATKRRIQRQKLEDMESHIEHIKEGNKDLPPASSRRHHAPGARRTPRFRTNRHIRQLPSRTVRSINQGATGCHYTGQTIMAKRLLCGDGSRTVIQEGQDTEGNSVRPIRLSSSATNLLVPKPNHGCFPTRTSRRNRNQQQVCHIPELPDMSGSFKVRPRRVQENHISAGNPERHQHVLKGECSTM